jgi:phosphoribosylformimino-5-aminoimidazole carboxamide ribotide isomerase
MKDFTIFPAIDLRGGRVVRLSQGDPDRETHYATGALTVARRWQDCGATWLHVVNLDGAFGEAGLENYTALARVLTTGLNVQFGGGLRTAEDIRRALDMGVSRVVLGTAAVEKPALVQKALEAFGPTRIGVGIDVRDGFVQVHGWQKAAALTALELAQRFVEMGGRWLSFTDVSRDGMSNGVNVEATADLARATGLNVIASGGVASLGDILRVQQAGLSGVIIGRALYEGHVDLTEAIATTSTD